MGSGWTQTRAALGALLGNWLLMGFILALLLIVAREGLQERALWRRLKDFPSTTAVITDHFVGRKRENVRLAPGTENTIVYYHRPLLNYRYTHADGQEYTVPDIVTAELADRHRLGSEKDAQAFLDRYPIGSTHTVFYNPDDPKDTALLNAPIRSVRWAKKVAGMFLLFVAGYAVLFFFYAGVKGFLRSFQTEPES